MTRSQRQLALVSMLGATFLTVLNTNMIRVASATILESLDVSVDQLTWVFNAYMLAYSLLMPLAGQIGDATDRWKVFRAGLVVFIMGSSLAATGRTFYVLVAARAVQGLGSALVFPNALVLVTRLFPENQRGRAVGLWGSSSSIGAVAGPSVGGFIVQYLGWRWVFMTNILIGMFLLASQYVVSGAMAVLADTKEVPQASVAMLDWKGTAALVGFVVSLTWAFGRLLTPKPGENLGSTLAGLGVTGLALMLLLHTERHASGPVVDLVTFSRKSILLGTLCGMIHMIINQSVPFVVPLFLEQVRGFSPAQVGLLMLPNALVRIVSSPLGGTISDRLGNKIPIVGGLTCLLVACSVLGLMGPQVGVPTVLTALLLYGLGDGVVWSSNLSALLSQVPRSMSGSATGTFNMARFVAGVVGTTTMGAILNRVKGQELNLRWPVPGYSTCFAAMCVALVVGIVVASRLPSAPKPGPRTARATQEGNRGGV